jgi:hypothetical protein
MLKPDAETSAFGRELASRSIAEQETLFATALGFYPHILCRIALPRDKFIGSEYLKQSGPYNLSIQSPSPFGVPYGIYPRGIMAWIASEVQRQKNFENASPTLTLGSSLFEFMQKVSGTKSYSGGKTGNIAPFKRSLFSLLGSRIFYWSNREVGVNNMTQFQSIEIATSGAVLWPSKSSPEAANLVPSTITLGPVFYKHLVEHAVPVDMRALGALWRSCLAVDIYTWLTHRAFELNHTGRRSLPLNWHLLKLQFGQEKQLMKHFRQNFMAACRMVEKVYTHMTFKETEDGLVFILLRTAVVLAMPTAAPGSVIRRRVAPPKKTKLL